MNKKISFFFLLAYSFICATSCIKTEADDREADIKSFTLDNEYFLTSIINERTRNITLVMSDTTSLAEGIITPNIEVSRNASVFPASGEPTKLDNYKAIYAVTSQDGNQKNYLVSIAPYIPLMQYFNEFDVINKNSSKPYDIPADPMWTNANEGVNLLYKPQYLPFPTSYSDNPADQRPGSDKKNKYVLVLETKMGSRTDWDKPPFLDLMDIPVYAGNTYRGVFDFSLAMVDPLKTTKFGQPFPSYLGKPLTLNVWYKYKSGDTYVTYEYPATGPKRKKVELIENRKRLDKPDMYAVLFKVAKGKAGLKEFLDGNTINNFTGSSIIAYASLVDPNDPYRNYETDWTEAKLNFIYKEEPDFEKNDYKLAIVLSSSAEGALYKGALGSKLIVDYLRVVCESDDEVNIED